MEFKYFDRIITFHLEHNLPHDVFIYDRGICGTLRELMKTLKGERWPYPEFRDGANVERIIYGNFTFFLADIV
jgi:hypothetical protein